MVPAVTFRQIKVESNHICAVDRDDGVEYRDNDAQGGRAHPERRIFSLHGK